ncbi:hypothetical protein M8542_34180 [Amycolatopsis sp. OK19-0408]|uniref:Uncharacterized protein n=1 Tax=Amycolatopsis iheyensis TaxID=2945988 RepID=A0A9X2SP75_9PSEU|nr:hypothetical protein [Amycolatopsis iheyensis]
MLAGIPDGSPGHREEFFGPVALFWTAHDETEQQRFVTEVETGMMYIHKFTESTPEVSFGGVKTVWIA